MKKNIASKNRGLYDIAIKNNTLMCVTIELLTRCNWKCKHCYLPEHTNEGFTKEVLFDLFKQFREMGVFEIIFTGGEMFCKKDIMEIIRKAREMHFEVQLFSNISLLDEDMIKELAGLYISNLSCTIFSLDEEIHDSITGVKGSLKKALNNISLLKQHNVPVEIKTILMKSNKNSYKALYEFCNENHIKYIATSHIFAQQTGDCSIKSLSLSDQEIEDIILEIDEIRKFKKEVHDEEEAICNSIKYSLAIDCEGNVTPCNLLHINIGNVYKTSIKDIWEKTEELKYLKSLKWKDLKKCSSCEKSEYCLRCTGIALLEDGDILGKSTLECKHASVRYKLNTQKG